MMAPFIRILLRWLGGMLIAAGYVAQGDASLFTDPDMIAVTSYVAAALCGLLTEGWYALARKMGWAT